MAFNAGEIIAVLKLDRREFNIELDAALAETDAKTKDGVTLPVKPEMDKVAEEEVAVEKEALATPVEFEVKPTLSETSAMKTEAELVGKSIGQDVVSGMNSGGGESGGTGILASFFDQMFSQGVSKSEITTWAKSLGKSDQAIQDAFANSLLGNTGTKSPGGERMAQAIVRDFLPTAKEMDTAVARAMRKVQGGPGKPDLLGQFATQFIDSYTGGRGWGQGHEHGTGGLSLAEYLAKDVVPTPGELDSAFKNRIHSLGTDTNGIGVVIKNDFRAMFKQLLSGGFGGKGGSGLGGEVKTLIQGMFSDLTGAGGGPMKMIFSPLGASAGAAFLGAFSTALGGAVAGTAIGGAGVFAALIPGYIALMQGMKAYTALSTPGASTKGFSKGALAIGEAIKNLLGKGSKGLSGLMIPIYPDITKFIKALTTDIPLIKKFAKPAIAAMGGFFDHIDQGMKSKNFSKFVTDMSALVGPIMSQFSGAILNLGGAVGGFLKAFGPVGKDVIGPWFDKETKKLDKFFNHLTISPSSIKNMKIVFGAIGEVIKTFAHGISGAVKILTPVGLALFQIGGFLATVIDKVPGAAPMLVLLGTGLSALAVGMKAVALAQAIFGPATALIDPEFILFAAAATALYVAIKDLVSLPNSLGGAIKQVVQWGKDIYNLGGGNGGYIPNSHDAKNKAIINAFMIDELGPYSADPSKAKAINLSIYVNASGHLDAAGVKKAAQLGVAATLPSLLAALARGAA